MTYIVAFDTETGGVDANSSILSAHFVLCRFVDDKLYKSDDLSLYLTPDDGNYVVSAGALRVNNIDLIKHDAIAMTYTKASNLLYLTLDRWRQLSDSPLIPLGHNVNFDINKITDNLVSRKTWNNFVSYRVLYTGVIARYLQLINVIPAAVGIGLQDLAQYYKIIGDGKAHTAEADTNITIKVFEQLMQAGKR